MATNLNLVSLGHCQEPPLGKADKKLSERLLDSGTSRKADASDLKNCHFLNT